MMESTRLPHPERKRDALKLKPFLLIFFSSMLLTLFLSPLRGFGSFQFSTLAGFTAYFVLTWLRLQKYKDRLASGQIVVAIILGACILDLPIRALSFTASLISFPDFIFHLLGIVFGLLFSILHSHLKWAVMLAGFVLTLLMCLDGYDRWVHRLNFGTFTGAVSFPLPEPFPTSDEKDAVVSLKDFTNKVVLLDFWHTACGVCFQKFTKLQQVFDKYKNNPAVMVLAVNNPLEDDQKGQAFQMIKERGYTFPVVISKREDLPDALGVSGYPTTFVVDQRGIVVFKGSIEYAADRMEELLARP